MESDAWTLLFSGSAIEFYRPNHPFSAAAYILAAILMLALYAFLSGSQTAIASMSKSKIHKMDENGSRRAKKLVNLLGLGDRLYVRILTGKILFTLLCQLFLVMALEVSLFAFIFQLGLPHALARILSLFVLALLLACAIIILGDLIPRQIALRNPERYALRFAYFTGLITGILLPLSALVYGTGRFFMRLFRLSPGIRRPSVTEEEILMLVNEGRSKGVIEESQQDMIHNIFDFDDTTAEEIMTHRTDIAGSETEATVEEIVDLAVSTGYSRIPVYENDLDNITGILYVKDLLRLVKENDISHVNIRDYIRPALFVPESNKARDLFKEFQEKKIQMAVVVDEYGGTSGLITMEDLLESIVGNIQDEYDNEEEEIYKVSDTVFVIDGVANVEEVSNAIGVELPQSDDYDTLTGLVTGILGRIPTPDEHPKIEVDGVRFTVLESSERRISKLRLEILSPPYDGEETH